MQGSEGAPSSEPVPDDLYSVPTGCPDDRFRRNTEHYLCTTLQAAFGQEFSEGYLKLRWEQWNEYQRSMSAWEVDATLDC